MSVVTQSHASTLIVVSLVWTLIGVYMLCARPYSFFETPLLVPTTNLYTDWPLVVVLILCVDVAINLLWLLVFIASTVYAHKYEMKTLHFVTVAFLHSHEQADQKVETDHTMIFRHTCVLFPTLHACVRNSFNASYLQIIGRACDVTTSRVAEGLMSAVSLTHHIRSMCVVENGTNHIFLGNMVGTILAHRGNEEKKEQIRQKKVAQIAQDRARARQADNVAAAALKTSVATASPVGVAKPVPPVAVVAAKMDSNITAPSNWKVKEWLKNIARKKQPPVAAVAPPVAASEPTAHTGSLGRSGPQHKRVSSSTTTKRKQMDDETRWKKGEETIEEWVLRTPVFVHMTPELTAMSHLTEARRIKKRNEKTCGCNPVVCYGAAFFYGLLVICQLWTFTSGTHQIANIL